MAVFADYGTGIDAVECFAPGVGVGDISDVRALGVDERGTRVVFNRGIVARIGLCAAGESFGNSRSSAVLDSCVAESDAGALRAVLDFDSSVHFERGEPGNLRLGCGRADAVLGKFVEGIGRAGLGGRRALEVCTADFAGRSGDVVSTCAREARGSGRMIRRQGRLAGMETS